MLIDDTRTLRNAVYERPFRNLKLMRGRKGDGEGEKEKEKR